ncbi:MAG: hypothetical protein QOE44_2353 [Solirubrobacteraceae bacterium]|jgi:hypothetical protein|nr:hypothetical protein [Solirubrobacteraceae bacterium]
MTVPPNVYPKGRGDAVKSQDWNDGFAEVDRLDATKVSTTGGQIDGTLDVKQLVVAEPVPALTVGDLTVNQSMTVPSGALGVVLGMHPIFLSGLNLPHQTTGFLSIEQYPVNSPPLGPPAFFRLLSANPPTAVTVLSEVVTDVSNSVSGLKAIVRVYSFQQISGAPITLDLVVFTSVPESDFKPEWRVRNLGGL